METDAVHAAATQVAQSDIHAFFVSCGGGVRAAGRLWDVPGSSGALGAALFCNDTPETDDFLGFSPGRYVTRETALHLAMAAYERASAGALRSGRPERRPVGVAVTASVASKELHRGDHHAFVASFSAVGCYVAHVTFDKGVGYDQRRLDGAKCEAAALSMLALHLTSQPINIPASDPVLSLVAEAELRELFMVRPLFCYGGNRSTVEFLREASPNVLMATLNPLHEGHEGQLSAVEDMVGGESLFVVSTKPRHGKQPPYVSQMLDRAAQVRASNQRTGRRRHVVFSDDMVLNEDVAANFKGTGIVIGADALLRMLESQWYPDGDVAGMLNRISSKLCHFYVFGRTVGDRWVSAEEACTAGNALTPSHVRMFHRMDGRWDVSSSRLRAAKK